jgi:hypothetical protein
MGKPDDEKRQEEIDDVIREEISRRRPIDTDAMRKRHRQRRDALLRLRSVDERTLRGLLVSEYGLKPGSPELEDVVRAWRAMQRSSF